MRACIRHWCIILNKRIYILYFTGYGVFAARDVPTKEFLLEYAGERCILKRIDCTS